LIHLNHELLQDGGGGGGAFMDGNDLPWWADEMDDFLDWIDSIGARAV